MKRPREESTEVELKTFAILPIKGRFDQGGTNIRRGIEMASISRNIDNEWLSSSAALREFQPPKIGSDLNAGFDVFEDKRDKSKAEGVDPILRALDAEQCSDCDFVTWRGNLTKILTTPYCRNDSWEIGVQRRHGRIFLDVRETADEVCSRRSAPQSEP